jgi:hypothetical protein
MIVVAPASQAPAMAASPTPPHPITAIESPRPTPPVLIAAPRPAITPQPSSPRLGLGLGDDLRALAGVHERLLDERADAQRRESSVPSSSVIFCAALCVVKQYQGCRGAGAALPQTARQLRMT